MQKLVKENVHWVIEAWDQVLKKQSKIVLELECPPENHAELTRKSSGKGTF